LIFFDCTEKKSAVVHNDLFFDNLKGLVETAEELPFTPDSTGNIGAMDSCCISMLEYDDKGFRTKQAEKDRNDRIINGQLYTSRYANGHVKEIRFIVDGKVVNILSGELTKDGRYSKSQIHDLSGKLLSFYDSIELNDYGKIIFMKNFNADSTPNQTVINNYWKQIWVGGIIKDASDKEVYLSQIKLNEKLDPAEITQIMFMNPGTDTTITRRVYTDYDRYGNWIQCTETDEKGKAKRILKRRITYREK
jgi:hypothetical protein